MLNPTIRGTTRLALAGAAVAFAMSFPAWSQESNQQRTEIQTDVTASQATLTNLMRDADGRWFQDNIGSAKGVLLSSEVLKKARLLKAGAGGRALLLVKGPDGKWHGPVFYTVALPETNFKDGVTVSEIAALVMTDKGLSALLGGTAKLGGDVTVTAGPAPGAAPANPAADVVAYSRTKGAYGGVKLDGADLKVSGDWDAAYYGSQTAQAKDIAAGKTTSRDAVALLDTVTKAAAKK